MCIITLLIGIFLSYGIFGIPLKPKLIILLLSFFPFLVFLIFSLFCYIFRERKTAVLVLKIISIVLASLLIIYYLISMFFIALIEAMNPIDNPKYYNHYVYSSSLTRTFPKKIPNNVSNVKFVYSPGILQGSTSYTLYYVDEQMTTHKFNKKFSDKAIWIGYLKDYNEKGGLLSGAFVGTNIEYERENDFMIYLIEGSCYKSGSCNHGDFLFAAYNKDTHEVIYRSEDW